MDNRTDEKWYNKEYGRDIKKVLIFVGIILIMAVAFYKCGALISGRRVPVLPGEVMLNGSAYIKTANEKVQKAGYIPVGEVIRSEHKWQQMYESSEVFGYKTRGSELGIVEYFNTYFAHYFTDDSPPNNADNPGTTFNTILEELTSRIGEAPTVEKSDKRGKVWIWELQFNTEVQLFYVEDGIVILIYVYKK